MVNNLQNEVNWAFKQAAYQSEQEMDLFKFLFENYSRLLTGMDFLNLLEDLVENNIWDVLCFVLGHPDSYERFRLYSRKDQNYIGHWVAS